mgnify:CR=1 FL=1
MTTTCDIITVGGGFGGASFAKTMAEQGCRVLVLERETAFKDRVRGEWLAPWGVAEAQELGLYDALVSAGGYHPAWNENRMGPASLGRRTASLVLAGIVVLANVSIPLAVLTGLVHL